MRHFASAEFWRAYEQLPASVRALADKNYALLKQDPKLEGLKGYVQDSGEGRWAILDAIDKDVPVPTLTAALFTRFRSRQEESFAEKMLAAMRNAFGGHAVKKR